MSTLLWTPKANDDLIDIWTFVAVENPGAADRLLDSLVERASVLVSHPHAGPVRRDIAPELRMLASPPYVILYRTIGTDIEIVRVVHGARDQTTLL